MFKKTKVNMFIYGIVEILVFLLILIISIPYLIYKRELMVTIYNIPQVFAEMWNDK